ncbi:MAG: LacI family DNA-binding transcriptional regulator [Anaerolineae bacterium]|nr:LacI family DNA-binding transcriptional regulator [Anaerolineae bacterium]
MAGKSSVTIRDVAAKAGVSHQTVSRVINGSDRVLPETRAKVEDAIAELDYSPNAIARSMAKGRTGILACIAPNLTDYTFASLISGAEIEVRKHGYFLLSASAPDGDTFAALIDELVSSRRAEAIMVFNPYADDRHQYLPADFPVVFAGARPRDDAMNSVALDDVSVGFDATQHLLNLGHTRIGMVTGPLAEDCSQDRCQGFNKALAAKNLTPQPEFTIEGDWSAKSGYDALMAFAELGNMPSAIVAQNDLMAVGMLRAARDMGIAIPDQLSIIGIDDIPMAAYSAPPLTTIKQDFLMIGREAAKLLIRSVEEPDAPLQHLVLPAEMVKRRSTGPFNA